MAELDQLQPPVPSPAAPPSLPRRRLLRAAGLTVVVGTAAAACSPDGQSAAPSSAAPETTAGTSAPATSAPATSAPAPSPTAGASSPAAAGGPTVPVADVPEGGGVILAKEKVVVTQPTAGTFKAFDSTCTHKGCPVTEVAGGTINCKCHGSKFSIEDGSVQDGPAESPLGAKQATVSGDQVVVSA